MSKQLTLIVIGGFAGAGKTTLAARLAREYNYAIFSSDSINDALRAALGMSFKEASPAAYTIMWHLVKKQLQLGVTVIVDTHMAAPQSWAGVDRLQEDMPHLRVLPIILQATFDTHRQRIEERGRTNKEHLNLGGDRLEDVLFKYDFIEQLQRPDMIRVDANGDKNTVYELVEKVLLEQQNCDPEEKSSH